MNTKKVLAIALALIVVAIALIIPSSEEFSADSYKNNYFDAFSNKITEEVIYSGNASKRIAVIEYYGIIQEDENFSQFMEKLNMIKTDPTVAGVILLVSSPGGGVYESAIIKDKILEIKNEREIPFYTVMESVATSGGYYISAMTDKIYASKETTTGSIGVIMSYRNYKGLTDKLGIQSQSITSGKNKEMGSPFITMTQEQRNIFQNLINNSYNRFVEVVAEGRGMTKEQVLPIADGRIYDGTQAISNGLVDEIGYFDNAVDGITQDLGITNPEVFRYNYKDELSWFKSMIGYQTSESEKFFKKLNQEEDTPRLMYLYGGI